jgi:hypothetical protein
MKTHLMFASLLLSASTLAAPTIAEAKMAPCAKGAVIGGVAGHLLGHHAVAGAVVGCAGAAIAHKHRRHHRRHALTPPHPDLLARPCLRRAAFPRAAVVSGRA